MTPAEKLRDAAQKANVKAHTEHDTASKELLDRVFRTRDALLGVSYQLESMASAFFQVGMDRPAERLVRLSETLDSLSKALVDAHGAALQAQLQESSAQLGSIVSLALSTALKEGTK